MTLVGWLEIGVAVVTIATGIIAIVAAVYTLLHRRNSSGDE